VTWQALALDDLAPRAEAWGWWFLLVLGLLVLALIVVGLRRWLIKPMPHTPSDTTDAWAESGRRLRVPPGAKPGETDTPDEERS